MKTHTNEFLIGVISPISWKKNDEISNYSIFTKRDEDILLEGKSVEKNFIKYKNKQVKIFGHFLNSADDARRFKVTRTGLEQRAA